MKKHALTLTYGKSFYLTNPKALARDTVLNIKFAWQRLVRGWDDSVVWSVDSWLCSIMPDILLQLKNTTHGVPASLYKGNDEESVAAWNEILDKMIAGFVCGGRIIDADFKDLEESQAMMIVWKEGMMLFSRHFFSLWD